MTVSGHQDFWIAGSRFYYKRDPIAGVEQPMVDLGIIKPANPSLEVEKAELYDSDGGTLNLADTTVTKLTEEYEITCNNMNMDNWALLMLGANPSTFTQTSTEKLAVLHFAHPGRLIKVHDDDTAATNLYAFEAIAGVYTGNTATLTLPNTGTVVNAAAKTIVVTGDQTANTALAAGKCFILKSVGLANKANSRTYTVVSKVFSTNTTITVLEQPVADETAITGAGILTEAVAGTDKVFKPDGLDWTLVNLDRGLVKLISGGPSGFAAAANVKIAFTTKTLSGIRQMLPQTASQIKGTGILIYGRGGRTEETVREARISITPDSASITDDDYSSMVLRVSVLNDPTAVIPAGRFLQYKGAVPSTS